MPVGKLSFLHTLFLEKEEQTSGKEIQGNVFLFKPHAKIQALLRKKEKTQNRHLAPFCTHPFSCSLRVRDK